MAIAQTQGSLQLDMGHLNYEYATSHVMVVLRDFGQRLRSNGRSMPHYSSPTRFLRFVRTVPRVDARLFYMSAHIDYAEFEYCGNAR